MNPGIINGLVSQPLRTRKKLKHVTFGSPTVYIPPGVTTYVTKSSASGSITTTAYLALPPAKSYAAGQTLTIADSGGNLVLGSGYFQILPRSGESITGTVGGDAFIGAPQGYITLVSDGISAYSVVGASYDVYDATFAIQLQNGLTIGVSGVTGGSLVLNGSTSGNATINTSATGVLALPSGTTATSMALTTPSLGAATATSILASGNIKSTAGLAICESGFYADDAGAVGMFFEGASFGAPMSTAGVISGTAGAFEARFPAASGTVVLNTSGNLAAPGAIGGTTASTGAFTTISGTSTLTLGVAGPTGGVAGTVVLKNATNAYTTTIVPGVVIANRQLNLPIITGTDTVAVLGLAQTFSGNKTFSGTVSCTSTLGVSGATTCSSTLAVTGATTLTGLLTLGGGTDLLASASVTTYSSSSSNIGFGTSQPDLQYPTDPIWIRVTIGGSPYYLPLWSAAPPM